MKSLKVALAIFLIVNLIVPPQLIATGEPPSPPSGIGDLWVASEDALRSFSTDDGRKVAHPANSKNRLRLAIDPTRKMLWAYGPSKLFAYNESGQLVLSVNVPAPHSDSRSDVALAVNSIDGTVWLAIKRSLHRFNPQGQLLKTVALSNDVVGLSFDPVSSRLWVASKNSVRPYDNQSIAGAALPLGSNPLVKALAVDRGNGAIWVALANSLRLYSPNGALLYQRSASNLEQLADDGAHGVWAAKEHWLYRYSPTAQLLLTARMDPSVDDDIVALVGNSADQSVWVASEEAIVQVAADGRILLRIPNRYHHHDDELEDINDIALMPRPQAGNRPPVAANDAAITGVNTAVPIQVLANDSDPDNDPLTITAITQGSNGAVTNTASIVTYTPNAGFGGTDSFTYTIGDGKGGSATATVTVTVDRAPLVNAGADQTITLPAGASLVGSVTDDGLPAPANLTQVWSRVSGPGTVSFGNAAAASTSATFSLAGVYVLRLTASDGFLTAFDDVQITVNAALPVNRPPAITTGAPTTATVNQLYSYDVDASDPDAGDLLTFSLDTFPSGMLIDSATGLIQWTPSASQVGPNNVTVRVRDQGGLFALQSFTIQVSPPPNRPPVITSSPVLTATAGQPYSYDVDATDPDLGNVLSYALTLFPAGMTIDANTGLITWTPALNQSGPHDVTVQVSDGHPGGTATQVFTIQVAVANPNNKPPLAQANSYTIRADQILTVAAPGVLGNDSDPDNDPLIARKLTDPTRGALAFNANGSFSYTPNSVNFTCATPPPAAGISFAAPLGVNVGLASTGSTEIRGLAKGDFNQDGFLDVAVTEQPGGPLGLAWRVALALGNGDGTFQPPAVLQHFATDVRPSGILARDVDSDGKLDLLVAVELSNPGQVLFYKGRGDGTFDPALATAMTQPPAGLQSADVNGDGKLDLVTLNGGNSMSVLLGNGNGTFQTPVNYPAGILSVSDLALGDVNGDGAPDIVVSSAQGSGNLSVLLNTNNGSGTFAAAKLYPVKMAVGGFYLADFNRDGKLDVVLGGAFCEWTGGNPSGESLTGVNGCMTFIPGAGDGTFTVPVSTPVPVNRSPFTTPMAEFANRGAYGENVARDLNGDGILDVVFGDGGLNLVHVRLGNGDGTFSHTTWVASPGTSVGPQPISVLHPDLSGGTGALAIDDFNGDGVIDIVTAAQGRNSNARVALVLGTAPGQFASSRLFPVLEPPYVLGSFIGGNAVGNYPMTLGDFNNDGRPELAVLASFNRVGLMPIAADGSLGAVKTGIHVPTPHPNGIKILSADFDRDGNLDVVWIGVSGLTFAYGDGAGQFTNPVFISPTPGAAFSNIALGDFNSDGFPDVAAYMTSPAVNIYLSTGGGRTFTLVPGNALSAAAQTSVHGLLVADFNGDGMPDVVVNEGFHLTSQPSGVQQTLFLRGNGDGTFQPPVAVARGIAGGFVGYTAGDVNHDGKLDLIGIAQYSTVHVQLGNGDGSFQPPVFYDAGVAGSAGQVVLADFDWDGHLDIALTATSLGNSPLGLAVLRGRGDGSFTAAQRFATGTYERTNSSLIVADVNNDGRPDLIVGGRSFYAYDFTVLLNNSATLGACTFTDSFTYAANDGVLDSQPVTVRLTIKPANNPPVITSVPVTAATVGKYYVYDVSAFDPDAGDRKAYALATAPSGMTIDAGTGQILWLPAANQTGIAAVKVRVYDSAGAFAEQNFNLTVTQRATVPNVVGQLQAAAQGNITGAGLTVGTITPVYSPTVAAGIVISQTPLAGVSVALNSAVSLVVSQGPMVVPGLVSITVLPSNPAVLVGGKQAFSATGVLSGGGTVDVSQGVTWASATPTVATIAPSGLTTGVAAGTSTISATLGAITGSTTLDVRAQVGGDVILPVATITTPVDGIQVTSPVDVIGTATDANFFRYELSYALAGETNFTTFGAGSSPVTNGVLGRFDPTLLINDLYDIKLTVFDLGGNETSSIVTVQVARELKIGLFTITFQDLNIPVSGIPITIHRTYDSRDKGKGDFGIGWRLGIQSMRIRPNREQGSGWVVNHSGGAFGVFSLARVGEHKVSLTLPNGKIEEFDMVVNPSASPLVPLQTVTAGYAPRPGTLGTLTSLDDNDLLVIGNQPGSVTLVTFAGALTYDPKRFRYTTADGTIIDIDRVKGVERVQDRNGNTLTFGPSGIIHSSGKSVTFTRDAQNRITQITDPNGSSQSYTYDAAGDLIVHTDPLGNLTRFTYNSTHGLLQIIDPLNRNAIRNEYDATGRLIAQTDAQGNRVTYTHNLNTQQEVITDRLGRTTVAEYDAVGNIVATTDALGGRSTATYDTTGNQLTSTNPLGQTITLTYDNRRNLLTRTDPLGNVTRFSYDGADRLLTTTDPVGNTKSNTYDARGNLLSTTDGAGGTRRFTYDAAGNALTVQDAVGNTTQLTYSTEGFMLSATDPEGVRATFTRDAVGNLLTDTHTLTTQAGSSPVAWAYAYDAKGNATRITSPVSNTPIAVQWNAVGQIAGSTDPLGNQWQAQYDAVGNLNGRTIPGQPALQVNHDAEGQETGANLPGGGMLRRTFDPLGRPINISLPGLGQSAQSWDSASRKTSHTDPLGNVTTFSYDAAGRRNSETKPGGAVTTYGYDAAGRVTSITDPTGRVYRYAHDGEGRTTRMTLPDGTTRPASYDGNGQIVSRTGLFGDTWSYTYGPNGQVETVRDPVGNTTTYGHDSHSVIDRVTDAQGRVSTFVHDALGRPLRRTLPGGQTATCAYDPLGRRTSCTDFAGVTTQFTYNDTARSFQRTAPNETEQRFFNPDNQLVRVVDDRGTTALGRDSGDRLTSWTGPDGAAVQYSRDAAGRITAITTTAGTTTLTYNARGELVSVVDPGGTTNYARDLAGRPTTVTFTNGIALNNTYDTAGRIARITYTSATSTTLLDLLYTRDPSGRISRIQESTGRDSTYSYDSLGRLTQERITPSTGPVETISYVYDVSGNLTQRTDSTGTQVFTYDSNDRLLSDGTSTYTWDANGNLTSRTGGATTETYTYDSQNRLVRFIRTGTSPMTVDYAYDVDGLLASRTVAGAQTRLVWDRASALFPQLLEERDATNALLRRYEHGDWALTHVRDAGGATSFFLNDHLGTVRATAATNGSVTAQFAYDAFGRPQGTNPSGIGYTNGYTDPGTGLIFMRSRWYAPTIARFIHTDSAPADVLDPRTLNRYVYSQDDPVNQFDPTGQTTTIELSTVSNIISGLALAFTGLAYNDIRKKGGGIFTSLFNVMQHFGERFDATIIPIAPSLSLGGGVAGFTAGLEVLNFYQLKKYAAYFYVGTEFSSPSGSLLSAKLSVDLFAPVFNTPTPGHYEGWFVNLSGSRGLFNVLGTKAVSGGSGPALSFFWSPTPTYYVYDKIGGLADTCPTGGCTARYGHGFKGGPSGAGSFSMSISLTYYFQIDDNLRSHFSY